MVSTGIISDDTRRCCINGARSVDVYAQRSLDQPPIKSDSRVTAYFCQENAQGHTQDR
ncbi:MAG: hypothetical protein V3Q69_01570 [Burkholderia sp.]